MGQGMRHPQHVSPYYPNNDEAIACFVVLL